MNDSFASLVAPGTVSLERLLPGPIERIWDYLTDSALRGQWLATGDMQQSVGSAFRLNWRNNELSADKTPAPERFRNYTDHSMDSRITRCEPPRVLAFTWGDDAAGEVLFELTARGDKVHLVITHRGLVTDESLKNVASGWHAHLTIVLDILEHKAPRNFWHVFETIEAQNRQRMHGAA